MRDVHHRQQVDGPGGQPLARERQHHGGARMRGRDHVERRLAGRHDSILPEMLLVVDVGNTQTHFGTSDGTDLLEHWRFATVRESTADELGARLAALLGLRGMDMRDLDASIVSSTVPQLAPEWTAMAERYLGHQMLVVGSSMKTGMALRYDTPREIGADRL